MYFILFCLYCIPICPYFTLLLLTINECIGHLILYPSLNILKLVVIKLYMIQRSISETSASLLGGVFLFLKGIMCVSLIALHANTNVSGRQVPAECCNLGPFINHYEIPPNPKIGAMYIGYVWYNIISISIISFREAILQKMPEFYEILS